MKELLFLLVLFVSNVIQAITGFAGTVLAMPPSVYLLGLDHAKVILNAMAWLSGLMIAVTGYRHINWKELFNDLAAHYSGAELAAMQAQYIGMFQAGWFVESMWSQTLVIHMIRTPKLPFIQSRASAPVTLLTMTGIAVLTVIPFTALGTALGLVGLPASYFAYLIPCILLYMMLATSLKKAYVRHYGELL